MIVLVSARPPGYLIWIRWEQGSGKFCWNSGLLIGWNFQPIKSPEFQQNSHCPVQLTSPPG